MVLLTNTIISQQVEMFRTLPLYNKYNIAIKNDWLVEPVNANANVYIEPHVGLVFSNGIVSRTFRISPNCATTGLDNIVTNEAFLRSVRPEAEVTIDGITINVGGLTGQPIHNYLKSEWIDSLEADPASMQFKEYRIEDVKERFAWKKHLEWMPEDLPWPPPGK